MIDKQITEWRRAAMEGTLPDEENPLFIFNSTSTNLLIKMVTGEIDAVKLMLHQLGSRCYDQAGRYKGFN